MTKSKKAKRPSRDVLATSTALVTLQDGPALDTQQVTEQEALTEEQQSEVIASNQVAKTLGVQAVTLLEDSAKSGALASAVSIVALFASIGEQEYDDGKGPQDLAKLQLEAKTDKDKEVYRVLIKRILATVYGVTSREIKDGKNVPTGKFEYILPDGVKADRIPWRIMLTNSARAVAGAWKYDQATRIASGLNHDARTKHPQFPGIPATRSLGPIFKILGPEYGDLAGRPAARLDYVSAQYDSDGEMMPDCKAIRLATAPTTSELHLLYSRYIPFGNYTWNEVKLYGVSNKHIISQGVFHSGLTLRSKKGTQEQKTELLVSAIMDHKTHPEVILDAVGNLLAAVDRNKMTVTSRQAFDMSMANVILNNVPLWLEALNDAFGDCTPEHIRSMNVDAAMLTDVTALNVTLTGFADSAQRVIDKAASDAKVKLDEDIRRGKAIGRKVA